MTPWSRSSMQTRWASRRSGWGSTASPVTDSCRASGRSWEPLPAARRTSASARRLSSCPLHNPILVAEEVAMLDIISNGRINFGIGAGYQQQEFEGLGVDIDSSRERFREAVDVIIRAWTEERLTFHGRYTDVDELWVLPKPVQKPYPPLFQGGEHQPREHRLCRQPPDPGDRGRPDRHIGPGTTGHQVVAGKNGRLRPPPCSSGPAHVQVDLCRSDHGGGRTRPHRPRGFSPRASSGHPGTTAPQSGCPWTETATSPRATNTGPTASVTATAATTLATPGCHR